MPLRRSTLKISVLALLLSASPASAWDGIKVGRISGIDVTDSQNFGFRIYMDGTPMCGTTEAWAYQNKDFNNYDAMVSLLTTAYFSSKQIVAYTTKVGSYCRLDYVALR